MSKFTRHGYVHPCRRKGLRGPWERFRKAWMAKNPLCRKCGRAGKVLDHIRPLHTIAPWERITLRELLDAQNVQTLCRPCSDEKTAKENSRRPAPAFCVHGHPVSICTECQTTPE